MKSLRIASSSHPNRPSLPLSEDINGVEEASTTSISSSIVSGASRSTGGAAPAHQNYTTQDHEVDQETLRGRPNPKRAFKSLRNKLRTSSTSSLHSLSSNASSGGGSSSGSTASDTKQEKKTNWKLIKSSRFRYKRKKKDSNLTATTLSTVNSYDNNEYQMFTKQDGDDESECDSISLISSTASTSTCTVTLEAELSPRKIDDTLLYGDESMDLDQIENNTAFKCIESDIYSGTTTNNEKNCSLTISDLGDSNDLHTVGINENGLDIFEKDGMITVPSPPINKPISGHKLFRPTQANVNVINESDNTNADNTQMNLKNKTKELRSISSQEKMQTDHLLTTYKDDHLSEHKVSSPLHSNEASSSESNTFSEKSNDTESDPSQEPLFSSNADKLSSTSTSSKVTNVDGDEFFTAKEDDIKEQLREEPEQKHGASTKQGIIKSTSELMDKVPILECRTPPRQSSIELPLSSSSGMNVSVSLKQVPPARRPSILRNPTSINSPSLSTINKMIIDSSAGNDTASDLPSTPIRSEKSVSFADEDGGMIVTSEHHIAVSPNSLTRRVRRTNSLSRMKKSSQEKKKSIGIGKESNSSSSSKTRILVLLMHPESKQYELISLYFTPSEDTKLYTLLNLIPKTASYKPLQTQKYTGFCRPKNGHEMINGLSVVNYTIQQDEVLIAIPKGYKGMECSKLSKPILEDDRLVRLIKKLRKKQRKKKKKKEESNETKSKQATEEIKESNCRDVNDKDKTMIFTLVVVPIFSMIILAIYLRFLRSSPSLIENEDTEDTSQLD